VSVLPFGQVFKNTLDVLKEQVEKSMLAVAGLGNAIDKEVEYR